MATAYYNAAPSYGHHFSHDGYYIPQFDATETQKSEQLEMMAQQISDLTAITYQNEILEHMLEMEVRTCPDVASIDIQAHISWSMRPALLDFIIGAHHSFQLLPETLFLCVNILDRYCSKRVVYEQHYRLVGCAALFIASKYGDRKDHIPTVSELRQLCAGHYDEDMIKQMEGHILETIGWSIGHPTVDTYLKMILGPSPDPMIEHMALYICEMAMYHRQFVSVMPSMMAKTSLALARSIMDRPQAHLREWASGYNQELGTQLCRQLYNVSSVIRRKYSVRSLSDVTSIMTSFVSQQIAMANKHKAEQQQRLMQQQREAAMASKPTLHVSTPSTVASEPQTPHSHLYDQMPHVNSGCLTPPITPDTAIMSSYKNAQHANVYEQKNLHPAGHYYTPSPSPVAEFATVSQIPGQGVHSSHTYTSQSSRQAPTAASVQAQYARVYQTTHAAQSRLHPQSSYTMMNA